MNRGICWTEDEVKILTDGLKEGLSYREIGAKLGVNRNVISGKIHRMRNSGRKRPKPVRDISWDRMTFETWEQRKARLARERGAEGVRA